MITEELKLINSLINAEDRLKALESWEGEQHSITPDEMFDALQECLSKKEIEELLLNKQLVNKLHITKEIITELARELSSETSKEKVMEMYELPIHLMAEVISTCSDEKKIKSVLEDKRFEKYSMMTILSSLSAESLQSFLLEHKDVLTSNGIEPYMITIWLSVEEQRRIVELIDDSNLTVTERKEVIATLREETKQCIDASELSKDYQDALSVKTDFGGNVIVDFERPLEIYRGLDRLIRVSPRDLTNKQKAKFIELGAICPNMSVISYLDTIRGSGTIEREYVSSPKEYIDAEAWIEGVIQGLNPEYSDAQKLAVIDNAIGKKISYSADFDTEVHNANDARAMWRVISSGYGVCEGVALAEQYMLSRVGIDSEIVFAGKHAFLKIKDIELPLTNGETVRGNTINDVTWDLTLQRIGGKPDSFCRSYEEIRKLDIDDKKRDKGYHKNDEKLQDATLELDTQSLRALYKSVGLTHEDGSFPIRDLIEESAGIDEMYQDNPAENLSQQLFLFADTYPDFAKCQDASMKVLSDILLDHVNLGIYRSAVNRVFDRNDTEKRPVMYVYVDSDTMGQVFYVADETSGVFTGLTMEEFEARYECYDFDLERANGTRPWEDKYQRVKSQDKEDEIIEEEEI